MDWLLRYYNFRVVLQYVDQFALGLANTLTAAGVSLCGALAVAVAFAAAAQSKSVWLRGPIAAYRAFIRATPLLIQLYLVYYALPAVLPIAKQWNELWLGIFALILNSGAYMGEIMRSGVSSIHRGQLEASYALGLSRWQCFRLIVLPQALSKTLPPLLGQTAVLIKDTSLLSVVTVFEFLAAGLLLNSDRVMPNEAFLTVAAGYLAIYCLMLWLTTIAQRRLAGHLQAGVQRRCS